MNLTEENGFENNFYGQTGSDVWHIRNISLPISINDSESCFIHLYLSNNDYWGYRQNATCFLKYFIEPNDDNDDNNKGLDVTQLELYNILDINKEYNTFWNTEFLSNTTFNFGAYPICNAIDNQIQNVEFADLNVQDMIDTQFEDYDIEYDTTTHNDDGGENLTSSKGFWPYYFSLSSNQTAMTSIFNIIPGYKLTPNLGQSCIYSESLPTYDINSNSTLIEPGGISYYLSVSATNENFNQTSISELLQTLIININVTQYCDVNQPLIIETPSPTSTGKKDKEPLTLGVIIILGFAGCFLCMLLLNCFIFMCEDTEAFYETYQETQRELEIANGKYTNGYTPGYETNGYAQGIIKNGYDTKCGDKEIEMEPGEIKYVVSQSEHDEMLAEMRRGSISCGLEQ